MPEKAVHLSPQTASAFLPAEDDAARRHIVDRLIQERCPSFVSHWSWPVVRPVLYRMLGYGKARAMADTLASLSGEQSFEYLTQALEVDLTLHHLDRLPSSGRMIVAANHPTGLADGVAVWDAIRRVRRDVVFFANADAIRVNPAFSDVVIPVEWVLDKRSPTKTRETLRLAAQAFAEEKCVVIFPSGKLAREIDGHLTEQDWYPTVVSLARKQAAPIVPLNLKARNSRLYYTLARLNGELRDITLFHELLNKKRSHFELTFGPLVPTDALAGDAKAVTDALKTHVAYRLADAPHTLFGGV